MSEAACRNEVRASDGTLKPQVRRLIENGGSYVLFLGRDCVHASKEPRITSIRNAIESASAKNRGTPLSVGNVYIYDASEIASWVNAYPAAVASVFDFLGKPGAEAKSWREMSGYPKFEISFSDKDNSRKELLESLRISANAERSVTRLTGSSGLGKTRLVFEAFRPPNAASQNSLQAALSGRFCYLDATKTEDVLGIVRGWRRLNSKGIVVVDDCPFELHEDLTEEIRRGDSRLSIITIGNDHDPTAYAGTPTRLLRLEAASSDLIEDLLESSFKGISREDRRFIASDLAQGYPLMAIFTASAREDGAPLSARITPAVLAKHLGGSLEESSREAKVISACALFEHVGFDAEAAEEREFVRTVFCHDVSADDFYADIVKFQKLGVVTRYGRIIQVCPKPLAIRLAADWWEKCPPERAAEIVQQSFPPPLAEAFCERLRMLDFVPALVSISEKLCGRSGPFGQAKVLSSGLGSQLFRAIAEVNPVHAVAALECAFCDWSQKQLMELEGETRRNLVWALEKLAFRAATFQRATKFLIRLAEAENERWSNNATGVLIRLFMVLLSGTQAPLDNRIVLLRLMARSESIGIRRIAVKALASALTTDNFVGESGPEYQGSAGPLPQFRPKTWKEVFDYWKQCLDELVRLSQERTDVGDEAAATIASEIRGLVKHGRMDDMESALVNVANEIRAKGKVWTQAIGSIKNALKYDLKRSPLGTEERLQSWLRILAPSDIPQRIRLLVSEAPLDHIEESDGSWVDVAARNAEEFGRQLGNAWEPLIEHLHSTLKGEQRQAFSFGRGLAEGSLVSTSLYEAILEVVKVIPIENLNCALLCGWLSVADEQDPNYCDSLFESLASSPGFSRSLPNIARRVKLNDFRVTVLVGLLDAKHIDCNQLYGLSYGKAMEQVSRDCAAKLSRSLIKGGVEGSWVALDILFMYSHGDRELIASLDEEFSAIIMTPDVLLSEHAKRDSHQFEVIAERLIVQSADVARHLTSTLCACVISEFEVDDHLAGNLFTVLFANQANISWPIVRRAIVVSEGLDRLRLVNSLAVRDRIHDRSAPIDKLDLKLLRESCSYDPINVPPVIARIVRIIDEDENGEWRLSEVAMMLVDEFSFSEGVLDAIDESLHTFSWSGSLVPYFDRLVVVMSPLLNHGREDVQQWAQRVIEGATESKRWASQRDDERNVGRR